MKPTARDILTPLVVPQHVVRANEPDHQTDGTPCWCQPNRYCAECLTLAPCIHGTERGEVVVHREAS